MKLHAQERGSIPLAGWETVMVRKPSVFGLIALSCVLAGSSQAVTITTGIDTFLQEAAPTTSNGTDPVWEWDGNDAGGENHGLLRFDLNLDAPDPDGTLRERILATPGFTAELRINVSDVGGGTDLYRLIQAFDDSTTWDSFGGGVITSGVGQNAETTSNAGLASASSVAVYSIDVTADLLAWANGASNDGWAFLPLSNNGVEIESFESSAMSSLLVLSTGVTTEYIAPGPTGATWTYHDQIAFGDSNYPGPDAEGDEWYETDYDDSDPLLWFTGTGQFGYGDGDENTVVDNGQGGGGCNGANPCNITYLFRTDFTVTNLPGDLIIEVTRDDGIRIYINGVEVFTDNLTGPIDAATQADNALGGSDEDLVNSFVLPTTALVIGTNTIAVEIHNAGPTSSDVSFDLRLIGFEALTLVPEPSTALLLVCGLIGLAWMGRSSSDR